jgi:hypothetical protein
VFRTIALLLVWLALETWISWVAFCQQPEQQYRGEYTSEEYGCFLHGPLIASTLGIGRLWARAFVDANTYIALFTGILAISTIALWWSTRQLWQAGKGQMKLVGDSVQTAITANQISVTNAELQLRAYVTAAGGNIEPHRNPTQMGAIGPIEGRPHTYGVSVLLRNGGQTPAVNIKINVSLQKFPTPIPVDFRFPDSDTFGYGVIGPGGEMQTPTIHVEAKNLEAAEAGEEWCFWGWVEYDDIFEGIFRHRTEFCFRVERMHFPQTGSIAMGLMPHSKFNAVDWNCLRTYWPNENVYSDDEPKN